MTIKRLLLYLTRHRFVHCFQTVKCHLIPSPASHPVPSSCEVKQFRVLAWITSPCGFAMTAYFTGFSIRLCSLQQREQGKQRCKQPARRPVIATARYEAGSNPCEYRGLLCFVPRNSSQRTMHTKYSVHSIIWSVLPSVSVCVR
jgi:hypothetical protein